MNDPTVVVLTPYRPGAGPEGDRRHELAAWTWDRLHREHPTWEHHAGSGPLAGPFNRSAAINEAAEHAGAWDVAVIADCDSFVGADQLRSAVEIAHATGRLTFAYERFAALDRAMSARVMAGYEGAWEPGVAWEARGSCSSMVVVPRALWETVDGFDEGFVGWGFEDVAFSLACQSLGPRGGPPFHRVAGTVWHLWHPPAPGTGDEHHPIWRANKARSDVYVTAWQNGPDAMRELIDLRHALDTGAHL